MMPPGFRRSHQITQSLGGQLKPTRIRPHVGSTPPLSLGESLLLCSDGLTDMIGEKEISRTLDGAMGIGECAANLFELALKRGGNDNISIVIAQRSELKRSTGDRSASL
jgi:serine/threonine protein phosphatase PrpC